MRAQRAEYRLSHLDGAAVNTSLIQPNMLNSRLYQTLFNFFREVTVLDAGLCRVELLDRLPSERILAVLESGERFVVHCPFCRSSNSKLMIFYSYDPEFSPGDWHCSDGQCEQYRDRRILLASHIAAALAQQERAS